MLSRPYPLHAILQSLDHNPVVGILGARQVGKTTLARQVAEKAGVSVHWFDLEDPEDLGALQEAKLTLAPLKGLVVLDEIQRRPNLFPLLRVLADRPDSKTRFLVLGSASPLLLRQSSESLAGRIRFHYLEGFHIDEIPPADEGALWLRGGFPRSFLADSDEESLRWRRDFMRTYLERDLGEFGFRVPAETLHRFWSMLAHFHAQILNRSELARSLAVSEPAVRRYVDLLEDTFMVRQLPPWHENLSKRQVRSPKIYFRDSGLLHGLLGIPSPEALARHPKVGASWEGFALENALSLFHAETGEAYFWATHQGAELDLLLVRGEQRVGLEFKRTASPSFTPSMRHALAELKLEKLFVVHPGDRAYPLAEKVRAVPLDRLSKEPEFSGP
jgi:hypothetical protein